LLARAKLIKGRIEELTALHQQLIRHKSQLNSGLLARKDKIRSELLTRLESIEELISSGDVFDAKRSLNTYELGVKWSQPLLSRMKKIEDRSLKSGSDMPAETITSLQEIEDKIILEDYLGADDALRKMEGQIGEPIAEGEVPPSVSPPTKSEESGHGDVECGLCGAKISSSSSICLLCGYDLESAIVKCDSCGKRVSVSFNNCPFCSAKLMKEG
jgi:hypothetical protein